MIGLIIITHGNLAIELKTSLEHVIGPQKNLETISIGYEDDINKRKDEIKELINKVDTGKGVILLTKVEMIGGVNLPLLVKLGSIRNETEMKDLIEASVEAGHKYIGVATEILSKEEN